MLAHLSRTISKPPALSLPKPDFVSALSQFQLAQYLGAAVADAATFYNDQ